MIFKCRSCDAVMVFDPDKQKMVCPFCDSVDTEEKKGEISPMAVCPPVCPSCGGELTPGQFTSAGKCPFCGNYIIYDERVAGALEPNTMIPFKISKKKAVECMQEEFKSRKYTPASFLTEKTLKNMEGYYVPFFMYDYHVKATRECDATKTRSWREGNYNCTETSYYKLFREFEADYDNVPADASIAMNDDIMDLMEPYDYQLLTDFDPRFLSGFFADAYNMGADELEERAKKKVAGSADSIMRNSMAAYSVSAEPTVNSVLAERTNTEFALFPVWKYTYIYKYLPYDFYVNGQTGKVIGKTPVSKAKVFVYALVRGGLWALLLSLVFGLLFSL